VSVDSRRRSGRRLFAFVAVVAVGTGSALVATRLDDGDKTPTGDVPVATGDLGHVHAAGYNPADGHWYLGTHSGLIRVESDGPVRVADRYQDTMGLTVEGGDEFLASGHPDLRDDLPSRLGLIRSTDGGASWTAVSLAGSADLHAIAATRGRLYAADSTTGTVLASTDGGRTWQERATEELVSLAVDPNDADHVVGVRTDGTPVGSTDGAATFTALGGPQLTGVVWADVPVGLDPDGAVHALEASGWVQRGDTGTPGAVLGRSPDRLGAAAPDGTLRFSGDDGRTWSTADLSAIALPPCKPQRPSCRNVRR
jgi:hypothetical protein